MFVVLHDELRLLSCDESLDRLITILKNNDFDSGSHIDFYDTAPDNIDTAPDDIDTAPIT